MDKWWMVDKNIALSEKDAKDMESGMPLLA